MHSSPSHTLRTASPDSEPLTGRALVLGGGGSTGNAWLIGVLAGLLDGGLDATRADLIIGTSAGSTATAQITGASPSRLLADILAVPVPQPREGRAAPEGRRTSSRPVVDQMARTQRLIDAAADPADMRRRMGAAAIELAATSDDAVQTRWRATVASRIPNQDWPERRVLITAVDATSGDPVVFDGASGVDLADAVAASCASGFAYRIGDGRYIDGGYRSNAENADLAGGCARVLVLSPFSGRTRTPMEWGQHLSTQVADLRAGGSRVETVFPDSDFERLFGVTAMDPSLRPPAARAGFDQGRAIAGGLIEFWG